MEEACKEDGVVETKGGECVHSKLYRGDGLVGGGKIKYTCVHSCVSCLDSFNLEWCSLYGGAWRAIIVVW